MTYTDIKNGITDFFKDNFETVSTKKSRITGIVICAVLLLTVILDSGAYTGQVFRSKWLLLAVALCLPFLIGTIAAYGVRIKNDKADKVAHFVFLMLMPVLSMTMTECLNDVFIYNMTYLGFLGNYLVIILFYFIVYALSGSFKLPVLIVNPILFGFALAHSYIMDFRGTPFLPMDFLSVTTAVGVANTYNYTLTYKVMTAILLFVLIMVIGIRIKTPKNETVTKVVSRVFAATFASVAVILFYGTSVFADMGVRPDFWNQARGYHNYGFVFNFFCNTKYLYMSEPDGYNPNEVSSYVSDLNT